MTSGRSLRGTEAPTFPKLSFKSPATKVQLSTWFKTQFSRASLTASSLTSNPTTCRTCLAMKRAMLPAPQ